VPRVSAFYGIVITMYFNEGIHLGRPPELGSASLHRESASDRSTGMKPYSGYMRITPRVLEVKPTEGYRAWVRFEDGLAAEVDFGEMVDRPGYYTRM
jgi:hypothetical protein